jgi:L-seryl-tRNA(Ser) seleniumtransferase
MNQQQVKVELRKLPSVEEILTTAEVQPLIDCYSRVLVTDSLQELLEDMRRCILEGTNCPSRNKIITRLGQELTSVWAGMLSSVINATGVILHTNLGRTPLSTETVSLLASLGSSYGALEYDLVSGQRGHRAAILERMLCQISGAESALVVNNNAAAIYLVLMVLARGREAVVSRGELVQIGGGFRIPEVMAESGVLLKEVGTTNKTYIEDYEKAIGKKTALLLKVHQSNYAIRGFTHQVDIAALKELTDRCGLPLLYDLGSGALLPTEGHGLEHEPMVQEAVSAGADIVCFSGDKLLGGPQAGIILGRKKYVDKLRKHPLMRTLRVGRLIVLALEATLLHYLKQEAAECLPLWRMMNYTSDELSQRAEAIASRLKKTGLEVEVISGVSMVGGGSLPDQFLQSRLVAIKPGCTVNRFAAKLRLSVPPVLGRIEDGRFLLDVRTVMPSLDDTLVEIIRKVS